MPDRKLPSTSRWSFTQLKLLDIEAIDIAGLDKSFASNTKTGLTTKNRRLIKDTATLFEGLGDLLQAEKLTGLLECEIMQLCGNLWTASFFICIAELLLKKTASADTSRKRAFSHNSQSSGPDGKSKRKKRALIKDPSSFDFSVEHNIDWLEEEESEAGEDEDSDHEDLAMLTEDNTVQSFDGDSFQADEVTESNLPLQPSTLDSRTQSLSISPSLDSVPVTSSQETYNPSDGERKRDQKDEIKCETVTQNMLVAFVRGVLGALNGKLPEKTEELPELAFEPRSEHTRISPKTLEYSFTSIDDGSIECSSLQREGEKVDSNYRYQRISDIRFVVLEAKRAIVTEDPKFRKKSQICGEILAALYERLVFLKSVRNASSLGDVASNMTEGERTIYLLHAEHTSFTFVRAVSSINFLRRHFDSSAHAQFAGCKMKVEMSKKPLNLSISADRVRAAKVVGSIAFRAAQDWQGLAAEMNSTGSQ